jgi:hypothetical protein
LGFQRAWGPGFMGEAHASVERTGRRLPMSGRDGKRMNAEGRRAGTVRGKGVRVLLSREALAVCQDLEIHKVSPANPEFQNVVDKLGDAGMMT